MKSETQREYEKRILRVLVYVQGSLGESLDLECLAGIAHLSTFHFHRVFRGMVGEPVMEHVQRLRLERSAFQLKSSRRRILEIALEAGYGTHEAFTRAFRSAFRVSPSQFRRSRAATRIEPCPSGVHFSPDGRAPSFRAVRKEGCQMEVRIENRKPQQVMFMRHTGPYDQVGETWGKFMSQVFSRGFFPSGPPFAIVHDDPEITPPERLRYDACVQAPDGFEPQGEIGVQVVAGGPYAVTVHRGAYQRLGDTYANLFGQWLPGHGREPALGPCLEVYLNDPRQTPPDDLLTEVWVPLRETAGA